jgi:hypothetical protein
VGVVGGSVRKTAGKIWGRWKRGMSLVDMGHSSIAMHRFRKTNPLGPRGCLLERHKNWLPATHDTVDRSCG